MLACSRTMSISTPHYTNARFRIESDTQTISSPILQHNTSTLVGRTAENWTGRTDTEATNGSPLHNPTDFQPPLETQSSYKPTVQSPLEPQITTILPSDIMLLSHEIQFELISATLSSLARSSGMRFSQHCGRRTNWTLIYQALDRAAIAACKDASMTPHSTPGATIWTRFTRTLVDPEVAMDDGEHFNLKPDSITIKREMDRTEMVKLVRRSMQKREEKELYWIDSQEMGQGGRDVIELDSS